MIDNIFDFKANVPAKKEKKMEEKKICKKSQVYQYQKACSFSMTTERTNNKNNK